MFVNYAEAYSAFLYYVYLVAQVSCDFFAKVLFLFRISKDTIFSRTGAPLADARAVFIDLYFFY